MKTVPELAALAEHHQVGGRSAEEIVRIIRRRECVYKVFVCSCAVVCLLIVLAFWLKWEW
jgi:hypothetical protein